MVPHVLVVPFHILFWGDLFLGGQEVISSIRTVAAFTGEKKETARYEDRVNKAMETSIKAGIG